MAFFPGERYGLRVTQGQSCSSGHTVAVQSVAPTLSAGTVTAAAAVNAMSQCKSDT